LLGYFLDFTPIFKLNYAKTHPKCQTYFFHTLKINYVSKVAQLQTMECSSEFLNEFGNEFLERHATNGMNFPGHCAAYFVILVILVASLHTAYYNTSPTRIIGLLFKREFELKENKFADF
jgi:hypothetical protein